jgi:hypothetical protein
MTHPDQILTHRIPFNPVGGGEQGADARSLHVSVGQRRRKIRRDPILSTS